MSSTIELDITGMTCASCAARIEKKLNKVAGVEATVNYATQKARVRSTGPGVDLIPADLIAVVEKAGYGAALPDPAIERADSARELRDELTIAAALSIPVIVLAMVPAWQFAGWQWISLVLATPVVARCGWRFHRAALVNARHGATTMDTLISVGSLAAYLWSLYALLFGTAGDPHMHHTFSFGLARSDGAGNIYLEAACGIITFILAGRWFEARSRRDAGAAMRTLLTLGAQEVTVLRDGAEQRVPIDSLAVGDTFVVRPGEKIATDGEVISGHSTIDAAMVTGESVPVEAAPGDAVIGATLNVDGRLVVRATRVGADTQLARIAALVADAQTGKAQAQRLADRISGIFVPVVIVLSLLTLAFWLVRGAGPAFAFTAAVAVLIIACPCALGLATPTALMVGTGRGAQLGIVIRGPEALERTHGIDTVVIDKTGTITTGDMRVVAATDDEVLAYAAAAEQGSEHPIGRAIAAAADAPAPATEFRNLAGLGVESVIAGRTVLVGRPALLAERDIAVPGDLTAAIAASQRAGRTPVAVAIDGRARGIIEVADAVKPTSADAIARFGELGLRPILLTGDNEATAREVAAEVGIAEVIAEVLPERKAEVVAELQTAGRRVAMIGDGVNDAAALATADLGIALGTGTDAAMEAADLTLMRGDLRLAADAVRLSRATLRTIHTNLFWAFAYNIAALPIAAAGFLNPMLAGGAMALSSVFVVTNSLRLRGFRAASV